MYIPVLKVNAEYCGILEDEVQQAAMTAFHTSLDRLCSEDAILLVDEWQSQRAFISFRRLICI